MTTAPTKTRIPNPLYAAAGAADYAYEKLRDLQARVVEQRPTFISGAQAAQERAVAIYTDLVARGEKVVRSRARAAQGSAGEIADTAAADGKRTTRRSGSTTTK